MIKIDIEMPESCGDCTLNFSECGYCYCDVNGNEITGYYDEKPENCPLIEVKK